MMNFFYGGTIRQDKISQYCHEQGMWNDKNPLGHGKALSFINNYPGVGKSVDPLVWALGITKDDIETDKTWDFIANAIITYRPVCLIWQYHGHSSAICGVKIDGKTKKSKIG